MEYDDIILKNYQVVHEMLSGKILDITNKYQLKLTGGAIGFYRNHNDENNGFATMGMRVFPLDWQLLKNNLPMEPHTELAKKIAAHLHRRRECEEFDHLLEFRKSHLDKPAVEVTIDPKHVLDYSKVGFTRNLSEKTWKEVSENWESIVKDKDCSKALDHIQFETGAKNLYIVPVPLLSSPSILVFFDDGDVRKLGQKKNEFLAEVFHGTAEIIHAFLYNRVMQEFLSDDKAISEFREEQDLFRRFVDVMNHILLPISFRIDEQSQLSNAPTKVNHLFTDYFNWYNPSTGNNGKSNYNELSIEFHESTLARESNQNSLWRSPARKLTLWLPDFLPPIANNTQSSNNPKIRMSETEAYRNRLRRISLTMNNIYKLLFRNWASIKSSEESYLLRYQNEMKEEIGRIGKELPGIQKQLSDFKTTIRSLSALAGNPYYNQNIIICRNGHYQLVFEGTTLTSLTGYQEGLKVLHHIFLTKKWPQATNDLPRRNLNNLLEKSTEFRTDYDEAAARRFFQYLSKIKVVFPPDYSNKSVKSKPTYQPNPNWEYDKKSGFGDHVWQIQSCPNHGPDG